MKVIVIKYLGSWISLETIVYLVNELFQQRGNLGPC